MFKLRYTCEYCGKEKVLTKEEAKTAKCECENKLEINTMKEKYASGDYICIVNHINYNKWEIVENCDFSLKLADYKLIHKKHKEVLEAYLADNNVEIEKKKFLGVSFGLINNKEFINCYEEDAEYRLKQQYPIFKRNEYGEMFRWNSKNKVEQMLSKTDKWIKFEFTEDINTNEKLETVPYDKERGLYHLQPVWCRLSKESTRYIDFYDVELGLTRINGILSYELESFEPITKEQLISLPFIWDLYKELLKDK